jgi:hypothetical protein
MNPNSPVAKDFLLGCSWRGVQHLVDVPIRTQFEMIRDSGVFDYLDRLPLPEVLDEYLRYSEEFNIPIYTCTYQYVIGRDEKLLERNMHIAAQTGVKLHNIMIYTNSADGRVVTDDQIVDCYLRTWEIGDPIGVHPSFEMHVNMWSEAFPRVRTIAEKVQEAGVTFNFTMDYSHCIFKIENPKEQDISGIRSEVEAGQIVLDPFESGSLCDEWLEMNIVPFVQFRPAAPNGPPNIWATNEQGNDGRGIQYPFTKPAPGEWHSPWHAYKNELSKEALRKVFRYHLTHAESPLRFVSTEMINLPDYGMNAKYSLFEHNVACARWIRAAWDQMKEMHTAGIPLAV